MQCKSMKTQSIDAMNACSVPRKVNEDGGDSDCELMHTSIRGKVLIMDLRARRNPRTENADGLSCSKAHGSAKKNIWKSVMLR